MLTTLVLENLGHKLTVGRDKYVIIIETKRTLVLILFLATIEETSQKDAIKFSIDKVITNVNNSNVTYLELSDELENTNNENIQLKLQQLSKGDIRDRGTRTDKGGKQNK